MVNGPNRSSRAVKLGHDRQPSSLRKQNAGRRAFSLLASDLGFLNWHRPHFVAAAGIFVWLVALALHSGGQVLFDMAIAT